MKLPTYPKDGNQALRSSGLRYTRVLTSPFLGSNFCQGARRGFSTLRALFFFSFQFFSFLCPLFFLFFFFCYFILIFCIDSFLFFSLALTFAWVALPGFRPSEPLKGKNVAWSMPNGYRVSKSSVSRRVAVDLQDDSSSALRACLISLPLVRGVLPFQLCKLILIF